MGPNLTIDYNMLQLGEKTILHIHILKRGIEALTTSKTIVWEVVTYIFTTPHYTSHQPTTLFAVFHLLIFPWLPLESQMDLALSVAQTVFAVLQCSQLRDFLSVWGYKSELDSLESTVETIRAVFCTVDRKQAQGVELNGICLLYTSDAADE